jgi:hypothetical protein
LSSSRRGKKEAKANQRSKPGLKMRFRDTRVCASEDDEEEIQIDSWKSSISMAMRSGQYDDDDDDMGRFYLLPLLRNRLSCVIMVKDCWSPART